MCAVQAVYALWDERSPPLRSAEQEGSEVPCVMPRGIQQKRDLMTKLGLTLHPEKTRVLDARREDVAFLGHTHRWRFGRLYLDIAPKAMRRIRDELRQKTRRT